MKAADPVLFVIVIEAELRDLALAEISRAGARPVAITECQAKVDSRRRALEWMTRFEMVVPVETAQRMAEVFTTEFYGCFNVLMYLSPIQAHFSGEPCPAKLVSNIHLKPSIAALGSPPVDWPLSPVS